jgi:hypothetical protein
MGQGAEPPGRDADPADDRSSVRALPASLWAGGRRLSLAQLVVIAVIVTSLPAGAVAVFGFDASRAATADIVSTVFFLSLLTLLSTPWWPVAANQERSTFQKIQSTCFLWFGLTFTTHVTWELFWLLLHDPIVSSPDAPWAYIWWMYIDGGDGRYATSDPTLVSQEILSVINGVVGFTGLYLWWRSRGRMPTATLLLMATAVVHLYSTATPTSTPPASSTSGSSSGCSTASGW